MTSINTVSPSNSARVQIQHTTHSLPLVSSHLPQFSLSLLRLPRESLVICVGPTAGRWGITSDLSVAMTAPKTATRPQASSSTSLSNSSPSSLSLALSSKLSKRYSQQIFLSLDLTSVAGASGGSSGPGGSVILQIEKAIVICLDKELGYQKK